MTSGEPKKRSEGGREADELRQPDPWGVKRAENLLTSLNGVLSARIEVSPVGEITGVHLLTNAEVTPKQTVRNVESALLAHFGLKVDHRKVSVAQTAEVRPIQALEVEAVRSEATRRPLVFKAYEVRAAERHRVVLSVTLVAPGGQEVTGEEEVADTVKARVSGAARAVARALDKVLPTGTLDVAGVKQFDAFDAKFMCAGVNVVEGRETRLLLGTAEIREDAERSAVFALLDATNRWMQGRQ